MAPRGEETTFQRDMIGNIIQKTDGKGGVAKYSYDIFNRLVRVETGVTPSRATGDVTTYSYSETGQLLTITDPQSNVTTFEYNSLDQLIKKTTSLGQITELAYDGNGNVIWEKDPNGAIKTFEYSDADELTKKILPDNLYQMAYDDNGNLTSISDSDSSIGFTYEKIADEYVVKTTSSSGTELPSVTLTNNYDRFGNRTQLQTPHGNFNYAYDNGNRLTSVSNPFGETFGFQYDDANRLRLITRPSTTTQLDFDQNSFLTNLVHKRGGTTITQALYTSDAVGNRITKTTPEGSHQYSYDENYQLKTATNPEGGTSYANESFTYDSLGNRLNDQLSSYAYDVKSQRLLEDYQFTYSYDTNGNMVSKAKKGFTGTVTNYLYSTENQLIEVQFYEAYVLQKTVHYSYDALGRRTKRTVTDTTTTDRIWTYDGNEILSEYDGSLNVLATYTQSSLRTDDTLGVHITSSGASVGLAQASGNYHYLKDALGSVTDIVDSSGNLVQHYVYSSFGKIIAIKDNTTADVTSNAPVKTAYTFTNREWDAEAGLYYYRARYYAPEIGRFLQEDPDAGKLARPVTLNSKHLYVANNPLKLVDPSGRSFKLPSLGSIFKGLKLDLSINITLSQHDQQQLTTAVIIAAAITVGALTGGTAAPAAFEAIGGGVLGSIGGFVAGVSVGATFGALTGALIGGTASVLMGGDFGSGAISGGKLGLVAGALGGGIGALNSSAFGLGEASGLGKFIVNNYIPLGSASLLFPFTDSFGITISEGKSPVDPFTISF